MKNHKHIAIPGGHVTWTGEDPPTPEFMEIINEMVKKAKEMVRNDTNIPKYSPPEWRGKTKFKK